MYLKDLNVVLVQDEPLNAETPIYVLREPLTPTGNFYIRNHFAVPQCDPATWRLNVGGAVKRPSQLSLRDLQQLPAHAAVVTLECAGNGRAAMFPKPHGVPWNFGAVGVARFTGVPLHIILDRVGLDGHAAEVLFIGADYGEVHGGKVVPFARSLPLETARLSSPLLAWAMNDHPLLPVHGFPLRLVVPNWYGMASVKWLVNITVLSSRFDGYFQKEKYRYIEDTNAPEGIPVTVTKVRAVIGCPENGATLAMAPIEIMGTAWSGISDIKRVEVSVNKGRSWIKAELGASLSGEATPWRFLFKPSRPGEYVFMARATDKDGNKQPLKSIWNRDGYGNNVIHRVRVAVR